MSSEFEVHQDSSAGIFDSAQLMVHTKAGAVQVSLTRAGSMLVIELHDEASVNHLIALLESAKSALKQQRA